MARLANRRLWPHRGACRLADRRSRLAASSFFRHEAESTSVKVDRAPIMAVIVLDLFRIERDRTLDSS